MTNPLLEKLEARLNEARVKSWFDLGLFLDQLQDDRRIDMPSGRSIAEHFDRLSNGVALVSMQGGDDQQTDHRPEVTAHAEVLQRLMRSDNSQTSPSLFWIQEVREDSGIEHSQTDVIRAMRWEDAQSEEDNQARHWDGFAEIFDTQLARGSEAYNALIDKIWTQTVRLAPALARFVIENDIRLMVPVDICATPTHIPLTLSLVLVSELLSVPVLNISHSFYWEQDELGQQRGGSKPDSRSQFFTNAHLGEVFSIIEVCYPWSSPLWAHTVVDVDHRQRLVRNFGLNPASVVVLPEREDGLSDPDKTSTVFSDLLIALRRGMEQTAANAFVDDFREIREQHNQQTRLDDDFRSIALAANRKYLPGLTELEYMVFLKSLIDPSAFRMEEKAMRGRVFEYAETLVERHDASGQIEPAWDFYRAVGALFEWHEGEDDLVVDHSLSYRHRNRRHYPFRKITEPELKGWVNRLFEKSFEQHEPWVAKTTLQHILGSGAAIDQSDQLTEVLKSKRPLAWIPDWTLTAEAEHYLLPVLQARIDGDDIQSVDEAVVTLFAPAQLVSGGVCMPQVRYWLEHKAPELLRQCWRAGYIDLQETQCLSQGFHLAQVGHDAAVRLAGIRDSGGFVLAFGMDTTLTLDLLDMESYRVGYCHRRLFAEHMSVQKGEGFVLWVPAGLRPSLAYPTPIQTPRAFAQALESEAYEKACGKLGRDAVLAQLREDADRYGTPVSELLQDMLDEDDSDARQGPVDSNLLTGVHDNGDPWSGAYARISADNENGGWDFYTAFAEGSQDTVMDMVHRFEAAQDKTVSLAWNGGFILNPELIGKLGLAEEYIGTALGLLIDRGSLLSPPLFNKPALAFTEQGEMSIREANVSDGVTISDESGHKVVIEPAGYNQTPDDAPAVYDLMHDGDVPAAGRVIYRTAGDQVLEAVRGEQAIELLPVGLTISLPLDQDPGWARGTQLSFAIEGWDDVFNAIEAGPLLVRDGKMSIEMEQGGWTTETSIRTQAARIDYTHMRGPKIGLGLTQDNDLMVVAINGRIRESVGATHTELAQILLDMGAVQGMGFDPGGSVTLVVNGRQLNISPYNKDYLSNPYSLPPQARFVGNAILGVFEEKT